MANKEDNSHKLEKEMREVIRQDVVRTCQEFEYFNRQSTQNALISILFLWGKENPDFGYKQGMNEILALIMIVFDTERISSDINWSDLTDEQIASDYLKEFLFDADQAYSDMYAFYDRLLQLGIKMLYQDTKDISDLRK